MAAGVPEGTNFEEMLLDVVAEKTGYPKEILSMDMGLESDLGIDSIKRVEIFSSIKDENPWIPEVDASEMASIQTLGDVLAFIVRFAPSVSVPAPGLTGSGDVEFKEPSDQQTSVEVGSNGIGRYDLLAVQAPHAGFYMKGLMSSGPVFVTDEGTGIAPALVEKLTDQGVAAQVVDDVPAGAGAVVFLGGLRDFSDEAAALEVNREAFLVARKCAERLTASGGVFVTVQDTGGDFGLSGANGIQVWTGGLPGLIKTAALEWPEASIKAVDLEKGGRSADELAESLCSELLAGGPEKEVGIRADGTRVRLECRAAEIDPAEHVLNEQSVIVASGGARGVTAGCLIELARQVRPRFAMLGRTPLEDEPLYCHGAESDGELKRVLLDEAKARGHSLTPAELGAQACRILANREIRSTLASMQEAGSEARYFAVDVQDAEALSEALEEVRGAWGPITGIIHGAGVLHDKFIAEKTPEQFDRVFDTKVQGLRSLLSATSSDPLKVICLFSSVAARYGNLGQCDYAMANEILNKVAGAEARRREGNCIVKSLNWGPWDGGMVSPLLKAHFQEMGIPLIPPDVGARALVDEIGQKNPRRVEVVLGTTPEQGGLTARGPEQERALGVLVDRTSYPFLDSHRIKSEPVVPVAMALEWCLRAARLSSPNLKSIACRDLRVLRGIPLEGFQGKGDRLTVCCRPQPDGLIHELALKRPGVGEPSCYTATVELGEIRPGPDSETIRPPVENLAAWPWDLSEIYGEHLFHGTDFQVIRSLGGVSDTSASAVLAGSIEMGWPGGPWETDAAALDGGLQLAILWGLRLFGKQTLPTAIGACVLYGNGPVNGPVRCELNGRAVREERTISTISFFDENGNLKAEMRDVEMHAVP